MKRSLLPWLRERGCVHDVSHEAELSALLDREPVSFYCGFDPTAESLHVGSMLPLLLMRRFQQAGHKPIVVVGSATGMIGDPSGKSEERKLLDAETLERNVAGIESQISRFLDPAGPNGFRLVKNDQWLNSMSYIEFLRDVGKHFTINTMMAKDSVRSRFEEREQGISYTEFSYMLLQAYDFYWLSQHLGCRLQVGGSDQWGNITAGMELIRRKTGENQPQAFGLTFPLLMTSAGTKFGKTERGTVWLDGGRTSPYQFYQYWLNTADADVLRCLLLFTDIEGEELETIQQAIESQPEQRAAQQRLASELTQLVHGADELARAKVASRVLFGEKIEHLAASTLREIFQDVPTAHLAPNDLDSGMPLVELLVKCGVSDSKGAARRAIEGGGLYLNNERVSDPQTLVTLAMCIDGQVLVIRSGKKNYHLLQIGAA